MPASEPELRKQIKQVLVTALRLENVNPDSIGDEDPLFSPESPLGLDSLSALELLSALEYNYKVRFATDGSAKDHFRSVATLAAFVHSAAP